MRPPENDAAPRAGGAGVNGPKSHPNRTPLTRLASPEGVPDWAWERIARADGSRWAIAERDAVGEVIGTAYRDAAGGKTFAPKGKRGLILAWPLPPYGGMRPDDPVFVCEGASDTATLMGLCLDAVGTPMAGHGGAMLADLLADRHVVIVAHADEAGRRGAQKIADALRPRCASVRIIEPPEGVKDARDAVIAGANREEFLALANAADPTKSEPVLIDGAPVVVRLSDVEPEPVSWLWPGRIALGKLTLIAGDPGLGKSYLTLDIVARLSRGTPWPDARDVAQPAGGAVLLNAEDDLADTIRPRLDAAGADVARVVALQAVPILGDHGKPAGVRMFDLSRDLLALEQAITMVQDCRLVVIDPVTAYLGGVDSHKNADIRGLLAPLSELAARHGVAVVAVTHLNKNTGGAAIYRTMGSLAFAAAARAAWAVSKDRDDPQRRLLLPIKNNLGPDGGGLAFSLVGAPGHDQPTIAWEPGIVNLSADEALCVNENGKGGRTERDDAADWLREYLGHGPRRATDVEAEARQAGIAMGTLRRAKAAIGVISRKPAFGGPWEWALSAPAKASDPANLSTEDAHPPPSAHLGAQTGENGWNRPKAITRDRMSALGGTDDLEHVP